MRTAHFNRITPVALADSINSFCGKALQITEGITTGTNTDLLYEVSDIRAWAYLGLYFSNKLKAAVEYQKYLDTNDINFHSNAIKWLEKSAENWNDVVKVTREVYDPVPLLHYNYTNREYFHWSEMQKEVTAELEWLKSQIQRN
jgi:hypothetical protein